MKQMVGIGKWRIPLSRKMKLSVVKTDRQHTRHVNGQELVNGRVVCTCSGGCATLKFIVTRWPDIRNYHHRRATAKISVWKWTLKSSVHDFSVVDIILGWNGVWDIDL